MLRLGLGLNIKRALANIVKKLTALYIARVTTDSGTTRSESSVLDIYQWFKDNNLLDYIKFLWFAEAGIKVANPTDTLKRISKGYSLDATPNDWTQGTEGNQPYLSGDIAPTEKYAFKNVAGSERFLEFTDLVFGNGDPWTVTFVGNWDGSNNADAGLIGKGNDSAGLISLRDSSTNRFRFINDAGASVAGSLPINHIIGQNTIVSFVAAGDGSLKIYMEGALFETLTVATGVTFDRFLKAFSTASREFFGRCHHIEVMHYALTSLISSYHALLRTKFAKFETVQIGSQYWTTSDFNGVCGANGTLIPNVTDGTTWAGLSTPAWCYYNNDPATGAIYGKLYNWYAVKQLQDDIDAWNTANPTNTFGYHIPSKTEVETLSTSLGGDSVAGGKMKLAGTTFWTTPNTGADNASGFTALGAGVRLLNGNYSLLNQRAYIWASEQYNASNGYYSRVFYDQASCEVNNVEKIYGFSIRLLKD